jgi:rhodanese-related sulfurtransferase
MQVITTEELREKMENREELCLLDVREPHERAEFNIGGTFISLGKIQSLQIEEIEEWKNREVICYCRSGNRSGQACLILESLGFSNTKNLAGGMLRWQEKYGGTQ